MRNHNHATYKILLSYAGVDGKVITDVYYRQEHPLCLENLKNFVRKGYWPENGVPISVHNGYSDSRSHAIYLYEQLPTDISRRIGKQCAKDEKYGAAVMTAATKKAKESGESLSSTKARITKLRKRDEDSSLIEHEYFLAVWKYNLFSLVDFDYEEPVCACCGRTYPYQYTLNVNHSAYCLRCANEIANGNSDVKMDAETIQTIRNALYEAPDTMFKVTEDQIKHQIQSIVVAQSEFSEFVGRIADYYNAGAEEKDLLRIYNRVWKEMTVEKFNANINKVTNLRSINTIDKITSNLLVPCFDLEDVKILLKQLIV